MSSSVLPPSVRKSGLWFRLVSTSQPIRRTTAQLRADRILAEGLDAFVLSRREQALPRSWRLISRDLLEATDGMVDVTGEALRLWYAERVSA